MLDRPSPRFSNLANMGKWRRWLALLFLTTVIAGMLSLIKFPAANLLGAIGAGILAAIAGGPLSIPRPLSFFCQSILGCMIARTISHEILIDIYHSWPVFILMVMTVSLVAAAFGWLLARAQVLPGTTAIWGISPGAALVMTLMSESFGADSRLVAFMQYLRVVLVTLITSMVAIIWGGPQNALVTAVSIAHVDWMGLSQTMMLASSGMLAGLFLKISAAPMLIPLVIGSILNIYGVIRIELPWWLLISAYSVVGWTIGLRFTRQIVQYAFKLFPRILLVMLTMIFLCGVFALALEQFAGMDMMTAYLATSPGGVDAVAIISASIGGNMSFIMAVQTTRLIVVSTTSPAIAAFIARKIGGTDKSARKNQSDYLSK